MSRLVTTAANTATVASQAKIESLTSMAVQVRASVASLRALGNGTFNSLVTTSKSSLACRLYRDTDGSAFSQLLFSAGGSPAGPVFDMAALPASGDVIIYFEYMAGVGRKYAMQGEAGGSTFGDGANNDAGLAALATGAGQGALTFARADFDSIAILNAPRTGASRFAKPEPTDSDMVALYYFGEGSGTTSADAVSGGTAVAVGSATWATGGTWNAAAGGGGGGNFTSYYLTQLQHAGLL